LTIGERIKKARIAKGLTQKELADKVGVQNAAIYKYESGRVVNLKQDMIKKLSDALGVKPSYLIGIDEETGNSEKRRKLMAAVKYMSDEQVEALLLLINGGNK